MKLKQKLFRENCHSVSTLALPNQHKYQTSNMSTTAPASEILAQFIKSGEKKIGLRGLKKQIIRELKDLAVDKGLYTTICGYTNVELVIATKMEYLTSSDDDDLVALAALRKARVEVPETAACKVTETLGIPPSETVAPLLDSEEQLGQEGDTPETDEGRQKLSDVSIPKVKRVRGELKGEEDRLRQPTTKRRPDLWDNRPVWVLGVRGYIKEHIPEYGAHYYMIGYEDKRFPDSKTIERNISVVEEAPENEEKAHHTRTHKKPREMLNL